MTQKQDCQFQVPGGLKTLLGLTEMSFGRERACQNDILMQKMLLSG